MSSVHSTPCCLAMTHLKECVHARNVKIYKHSMGAGEMSTGNAPNQLQAERKHRTIIIQNTILTILTIRWLCTYVHVQVQVQSRYLEG